MLRCQAFFFVCFFFTVDEAGRSEVRAGKKLARTQAAERRLSGRRLVTTVTAGATRESEEEIELPVQLLLGLKRGTSAPIVSRGSSLEEKLLSIRHVSHAAHVQRSRFSASMAKQF